MADDRESLGRIAHVTYRDWLAEQVQRVHGDAVQLGPWEDLTGGMREAYMRIGSAVAARAVADAGLEADRMRAQLMAFAAERDRTVRELKRRADRAVPGVVRDALLEAVDVVLGQERSDEKGADRG